MADPLNLPALVTDALDRIMRQIDRVLRREMTPRDVSKRYGCAVHDVYRAIRGGELTSRKVARSHRIRRDDADRWIAEFRRRPLPKNEPVHRARRAKYAELYRRIYDEWRRDGMRPPTTFAARLVDLGYYRNAYTAANAARRAIDRYREQRN